MLTLNTNKDKLANWERNQTKAILSNAFGTGKTLLLRHKAITLAKDNPDKKVYYIVLPQAAIITKDRLFLYEDTKLFFENEANLDNLFLYAWEDVVRHANLKGV